jgi:hypothetical protein
MTKDKNPRNLASDRPGVLRRVTIGLLAYTNT